VAILPVVMFAVIAVKVLINAVANDKMFPRMFVTVVEARVVEPADKFEVERFVEVEFVIVPLVALIFERDKFPAERVVIVALVNVALVPIRLSVLVVVALDVEANTVVSCVVPVAFTFVKFPVPELRVAILPVEELIVVKNPVIAFKTFPAKFPVAVKFDAVVEAKVEDPLTVRLVNSPVAKARMFPRMLVTVVEARVVEPANKLSV
jgi:hypothetical protein